MSRLLEFYSNILERLWCGGSGQDGQELRSRHERRGQFRQTPQRQSRLGHPGTRDATARQNASVRSAETKAKGLIIEVYCVSKLGYNEKQEYHDKEATMMPTLKYSPEEVCRRGQEIYERDLRTHLENATNIGNILVIDIETGQYEVGDEVVSATHQLKSRLPYSIRYVMRIGYPAIYKVGGAWKRASQS